MTLTSGFLSADEVNCRTNRYLLRNPNTLCLFHLETTVKCSLQTFSEVPMDFGTFSERAMDVSEGEIGSFGGFVLILFRASDGNRTHFTNIHEMLTKVHRAYPNLKRPEMLETQWLCHPNCVAL